MVKQIGAVRRGEKRNHGSPVHVASRKTLAEAAFRVNIARAYLDTLGSQRSNYTSESDVPLSILLLGRFRTFQDSRAPFRPSKTRFGPWKSNLFYRTYEDFSCIYNGRSLGMFVRPGGGGVARNWISEIDPLLLTSCSTSDFVVPSYWLMVHIFIYTMQTVHFSCTNWLQT